MSRVDHVRFALRCRTATLVLFGRCFHSCRLSRFCRATGETAWFDTWKWGRA